MDTQDREFIELMIGNKVRDVLREELPQLIAQRKCLLNDAITLEEHKTHHRVIQKFVGDMNVARKAFLAGVVTTITGGILGLLWIYLKGLAPK